MTKEEKDHFIQLYFWEVKELASIRSIPEKEAASMIFHNMRSFVMKEYRDQRYFDEKMKAMKKYKNYFRKFIVLFRRKKKGDI